MERAYAKDAGRIDWLDSWTVTERVSLTRLARLPRGTNQSRSSFSRPAPLGLW